MYNIKPYPDIEGQTDWYCESWRESLNLAYAMLVNHNAVLVEVFKEGVLNSTMILYDTRELLRRADQMLLRPGEVLSGKDRDTLKHLIRHKWVSEHPEYYELTSFGNRGLRGFVAF